MRLIFTKPKLAAAIVGGILVLTIVIVNLQIHLTAVSAQDIPIIIYEDHLDFGTVFPGEHRSGNFIINIDPEYSGGGINYQIIQKIKPLPEASVPVEFQGTISEYCQQNPDDFTRCYRNLCPHLEKINTEEEGDTESSAVVGATGDPSDTWTIDFKVPAILGYVAQENVYGVVSTNGDYGCDISIDIIEE